MDKAILWWGSASDSYELEKRPAEVSKFEDGGRAGWWLTTPDGETCEVRGPSICVASGGGPMRALAVMRERHLWDGDVRIVAKAHLKLDGKELCNIPGCGADAQAANDDPTDAELDWGHGRD